MNATALMSTLRAKTTSLPSQARISDTHPVFPPLLLSGGSSASAGPDQLHVLLLMLFVVLRLLSLLDAVHFASMWTAQVSDSAIPCQLTLHYSYPHQGSLPSSCSLPEKLILMSWRQ